MMKDGQTRGPKGNGMANDGRSRSEFEDSHVANLFEPPSRE